MAKADAPTPAPTDENDPLAQALGPSPIEKFIEENKLLIVGGLAAFIVVVALGIWMAGTRALKEADAANAFSAASSVDDFNKLIKAYPHSLVAGNALLRKAALLEEDGKIDEARAALVDLRNNHGNHPLRHQASVILGRMAVDEGEFDTARDYFQSVPSTVYLAPFAQLQLGDLALQQGDPIQARSIYEPIISNFANNPWSQDVSARLAKVTKLIESGSNSVPLAPEEETATGKADPAAGPESEASAPAATDAAPEGETSAPAQGAEKTS